MSSFAKNPTVQTIIKICCILVMLVAGCIGIVYFRADVKTLAVYCTFLLFWVLIPGAAVLKNLRFRSSHISTALVRSFFTGFALNIILYYLSDLIGTDILLYVVGPLLSVMWIVQAVKGSAGSSRRVSAGRLFRRTPASFFVFAASVFLCSMFTTQFIYISPEFSAFSFIKIDFSYHAGIVNALTLDYPPKDPWIDGLIIQYHFFSEMLMAIPERLFGLASEEMILSGTPYLITPVFSIAMYSFFREFAGRKESAGLYCLAFHFSNMFILKKFANSWFLYHIYSNINNAGLGIACLLTALPLLKMWDSEEARAADRASSDITAVRASGKHAASMPARNSKEMLLLAVLVMLMTGIKGPVSLVLVGGIVGTLILGVILRKVNLKVAAMAGLSVISFVLIYVYVLGSQHENTTGGSIFNPGEVTDIFFLKSEIMDTLAGMPRIAVWGVLFGIFGIFYLSAFLLPFIVGYIRELILVLSGRKVFSFSKVTVYACCMVGFLGMMLLDFNGHSQVYFGFTASVLVPMIAFWFFEDMQGNNSVGVRLVRVVFAICICTFACTSLLYMYRGAESARDFYLSRNEDKSTYRNVTTAEYEGLVWIRDNTDEDSLIASDRYNSVPLEEYDYTARGSNTHFAYAVYSQRRQYIEGAGFSVSGRGTQRRGTMVMKNRQLYDPENEGRGDLARELDVDYVVVSKRFADTGDLSNEDYKLVFTNEEMDIYEVKDAS